MVKAWLVRSEFAGGSVMEKYLSEGVVSIDYDDLTSLQGLSDDAIRSLFEGKYPQYSARQVSMRLNTPIRIANKVQQGDYVVVTEKENLTFGKIIGPYVYDPSRTGEGLVHTRRVEWLKGPVARVFAPELIRSSLQAPVSFCDISHLTGSIGSFVLVPMPETDAAPEEPKPPAKKVGRPRKVKETALPEAAPKKEPAAAEPAPAEIKAPAKTAVSAEKVKTFSYPIRFNTEVSVTVPFDITQDEAARLAKFVRSLYFK